MTKDEIIIELSSLYLTAKKNYEQSYRWWQEEKEKNDEMRIQRDELSKEVAVLTKKIG